MADTPRSPSHDRSGVAIAALSADVGQEDGGAYLQLAGVGAGAVVVAASAWALGKGTRHYAWALREARARISEEKAWPTLPSRR